MGEQAPIETYNFMPASPAHFVRLNIHCAGWPQCGYGLCMEQLLAVPVFSLRGSENIEGCRNPWVIKIHGGSLGCLFSLLVASRPLTFLQKEAVCLPVTSRPPI